ncbi:MAG: hypothetical protein RRY13_09005, partial [Akkermansia sp.]
MNKSFLFLGAFLFLTQITLLVSNRENTLAINILYGSIVIWCMISVLLHAFKINLYFSSYDFILLVVPSIFILSNSSYLIPILPQFGHTILLVTYILIIILFFINI